MGDEGVLDREEHGGPGEGGGNETGSVAWIALDAAILSPFKAPMDGTEEGDDLGSVSRRRG